MVDGKSPKKSSAVNRRLAFNADRKFLGTMSPTLSLSRAGMVDGKSPRKSSSVKRFCLEFLGTMSPTLLLSQAGMVDGKSPKKSSAVKKAAGFQCRPHLGGVLLLDHLTNKQIVDTRQVGTPTNNRNGDVGMPTTQPHTNMSTINSRPTTM